MKDDLKYKILKTLAETFDIAKTMKRFPEIPKEEIQSLLLQFADTFKKREVVTIYVDGAARGNPGHAGIGVLILSEDGKVLRRIGKYLGKTTNNVAEYQALITALKEAKAMGVSTIKVFADSELMVKQIKGEYKIKSEGLKPLYKESMALLMHFDGYDIIHINREKNSEADRLANQGIDTMICHA